MVLLPLGRPPLFFRAGKIHIQRELVHLGGRADVVALLLDVFDLLDQRTAYRFRVPRSRFRVPRSRFRVPRSKFRFRVPGKRLGGRGCDLQIQID